MYISAYIFYYFYTVSASKTDRSYILLTLPPLPIMQQLKYIISGRNNLTISMDNVCFDPINFKVC